MDTPAKKSLWFFLLSTLEENHQEYVQKLLNLNNDSNNSFQNDLVDKSRNSFYSMSNLTNKSKQPLRINENQFDDKLTNDNYYYNQSNENFGRQKFSSGKLPIF